MNLKQRVERLENVIGSFQQDAKCPDCGRVFQVDLPRARDILANIDAEDIKAKLAKAFLEQMEKGNGPLFDSVMEQAEERLAAKGKLPQCMKFGEREIWF